jgi:hypothetical protein
MKWTGKARWLLWAPLLAVSAWLAVVGDKSPTSGAVSLPTRTVPARSPGALSAPATPAANTTKAAAAVDSDTLLALVPRNQLIPPAAGTTVPDAKATPRDPFSARNWNPPPPPATASQPSAPVAPPLPYAFMGKKQEGEAWEVYLTRNEQTFVAREGEVLEGNYRVGKIVPPTMTLTYLPLDEVQTLPIGETR